MRPIAFVFLLAGMCACRSLPLENETLKGMPVRFMRVETDRPRVANFKSQRDELITQTRSENTMNALEAREYLQRKASYVRSLYASYLDPYFGKPDKSKSCTDKLDLTGNVVETDLHISMSFHLPATKGLVYGVCDLNQHAYNSELLYLFCLKTGDVIELKAFWPTNVNRGTTWNLDEVCVNATL